MRLNPSKGYHIIIVSFLVLFCLSTSYGQLCTVNGGEISTASANILCRKDGSSNLFEVNLSNSSGPYSRWLITNQSDLVLFILDSNPLDLSILSQGLYKITHVSYNDIGLGIEVGAKTSEFIGCFDLSNSITIVVDEVKGGILEDNLGNDGQSICTDLQGQINLSLKTSGVLGLNRIFIQTDHLGNIEKIQTASNFSLTYDGDAIKYFYHLSYASVENLFVGSKLGDLIGCFDLSNPYELVLEDSGSEAGTIGTNDNLVICSGDGINDIVEIELSGNREGNNWFVATNFDGIILKLTKSNAINFEGVNASSITIRNIQYTEELIGLELGKNINDIEGCFDQSNPINLTLNFVNGGIISGQDGRKEFFFCTNDNNADDVNLTIENSFGNNVRVVTDVFGNITNITNSNLIQFASNSNETRYIFNIAYIDNNFGPTIGQNLSTLSGCYDISNRITVNLSNGIPDAGVISTTDNTFLCTGDQIPDIIDVQINSAGSNNSIWVLTDLNNNILDFPGNPPFDFTDSIGGDIIIRYIDFTGIENLRLGANLSELEGCFDLSNPLLIQKTGVNAGTIRFENEDFTRIECVSENTLIDLNIITENIVGDIQHYILTSADDTILEILDEPVIDITNMGNDQYKIKYISMLDDVTGLEKGNVVSNISGCFDLSNDLTISLQHTTTTPSTIFTNSATFLCLNDESPDIIEIGVDPGVGPSTSWVVTDQFGEILHIRQNGTFNFTQIPGDVNVIYNIKHDFGVTGIQIGGFLADLQGCYSISNPINIQKGDNNGGDLTVDGELEKIICLSDDVTPIVSMELQNNYGQSSRFLVTSLTGEIQLISSSPTIDMSGLGRGKSLIYNASYTSGIRGIGIGENLNEIEGCIDYSNPVTINRELLEGGFIQTTSNSTLVDVCAGEGKVDLINVLLTNNLSTFNRFVVVDENNKIVSLPTNSNISLEVGPTGNYYIYNLAYAANVDNVNLGVNLDDLNGCYSLSNAITVRRSTVDGGLLSFRSEGTYFEACISTGDVQALTLNLEQNSGNSIFVETNNQGVIQKIFQNPIIDLSNVSPGQCRIYNVSYFDVEGLEIEGNINNLSGCFSISNHVLIDKNEPVGGVLTDNNGATEITLCKGNTTTELINVKLEGNIGQNSSWVLTDINNTIVSTAVGPPFNLEANEMSVLKIYNISYESGLVGLEKGKRINQLTGCYSFSNPITVFKEEVEAYGLLVTDNFKSERVVCVDDDSADIVELGSVGDIMGDHFRYIVATENGIIEEISQVAEINFTQYPEGISYIYQISFLNGLSGLGIGKNINNLSGCYALSKSVKIIRVGGNECLTPTIDLNDRTINMELYPNPATESVFIHFDGLNFSDVLDLSIIDLTGKRMSSSIQKINTDNLIRLDISDFPSGLYFVRVSIGQNFAVLKFLKQ